MKTYLGNEIKDTTLGILYICKYNYTNDTIKVIGELQFDCPGNALNAYANIPNPESQLAAGKTKEIFEKQLISLHNRLNNPEWVKQLKDYL